MKPLNVCCAIIEEKINGNILIWAAKKAKPAHNGGLWEFPGGKMELGESPSQALVREIREELHMQIACIRSLVPVAYCYPSHSIVLHPIICIPACSTLPVPAEHESIGLFTTNTLGKLAWAPADIPVLEAYLNSMQHVEELE